MLFRIVSVGEGAISGNPYVRDINGRTFFPINKDMELEVGMYGYGVKTLQTKTKDPATDELVDLATPREILQLTAAFKTKQEAIEAAAEGGMLEAEVHSEVIKTAKALNLTEKQVAALADSAF